jgi:DNA polymerase-3 subunit delta'
MKFSEVPVPEALKQRLIQAIASGHVAHAQLFSGTEGGPALMLALAYSQYLNCENPSESDSCGQCPGCIKAAKFVHPDFHYCFPFAKSKQVGESDELNAYLPLFRSFMEEMPFGTLQDWSQKADFENRSPIISIKSMRETMRDLQMKSYEARYKVQIIWLPETMRKEGSNSFLKILEEPTPYTVFLLVSQEPEQLLPTIISRTQRITVPKPDRDTLNAFLQTRFGAEPSKADVAAALAEGNISEALFLLNEKEDDFHHLFMNWQRACYNNNLNKIMQYMDTFHALGREMQKSFLRYSLTKVRNAMAIARGAADTVHLPEAEFADLEKFGKIFTLEFIGILLSEIEAACGNIERNASAKMVFMDVSLKLAGGFSKIKAAG